VSKSPSFYSQKTRKKSRKSLPSPKERGGISEEKSQVLPVKVMSQVMEANLVRLTTATAG
jgi:hypothetical protein